MISPPTSGPSSSNAHSLKAEKARLREQIFAVRDALDPGYCSNCARNLVSLADDIGDVAGKVLSAFWPIGSELNVRPLMDELKARGALLCLPVVVDKTTIIFRSFTNEEELVDSGFGTKGPCDAAPIVDPEILLVPLAVFDPFGGRIGYGAGYYDRAISRLTDKGIKSRTFGLAYKEQQVSLVPQDEYDVTLQHILTPDGLIVPKPRLTPFSDGGRS